MVKRPKSVRDLSNTLREFIKQPNPAVLGTLRKDGTPHLTVVWYEYDEDADLVRISLTDTRVKYRNAKRDPRVSLAIVATEDARWLTKDDASKAAYKEVVLEGQAKFTDKDADEVDRRIAINYYGQEEGDRYADYTLAATTENRIVMYFKPDRIMAWDFEVEDDDHRPWKVDTTNTSEQ